MNNTQILLQILNTQTFILQKLWQDVKAKYEMGTATITEVKEFNYEIDCIANLIKVLEKKDNETGFNLI